MSRRLRDRKGLVALLLAGVLGGMGALYAPELKSLAGKWFSTKPIRTSGLGACGAPSEGESLVVIFKRQGDVVTFETCFLAGSRGTYVPPRSQRGPAL